ncbi:gamma-aminobutyric acid receptor subunit alpha-4 isoform x1 [Limosa lapponica baueri]|uniref:Gamma-aminobutyric acid receptor subunit alpha-4 isoform x1 n=1 Tax=Limosa lapponica baueri TaxID=1758121 RepID=A0A2I0UJ39_LIMLA|nr:gamma-aminobutyric acid receptor subunit alpha-4 isoform x1 [Limosa lapponica baueri]
MTRRFLNISEDENSTISPKNLCQCPVTLTVEKCFLMFRKNLLCFTLCLLPPVLSLGTTEKSLALSSLFPPIRYFYTWIRSPDPSHLLAKQSQLSQPFLVGEMLQSLHHLCGPLLDSSLQYVHVSLVLRSPKLNTVLQLKLHQLLCEDLVGDTVESLTGVQEEVITNALQGSPGLLMSSSVVPPADIRVVEALRTTACKYELFLYVCRGPDKVKLIESSG